VRWKVEVVEVEIEEEIENEEVRNLNPEKSSRR
jgi:hypothetical protein